MYRNQRHYYLNSANRVSGDDASNCNLTLRIPPHIQFTHVCVVEASIPKSYYLVQSGYNTFTIIENAVPRTITITPGNYSASSFRLEIIAKLNAAAPAGWVYDMAIPSNSSPQTGKWTYTVTGNGGSQPSIVTTTNVYEQLGFNANTTHPFVANSLMSTNVIKMQSEDALYLHSDMVTAMGDDVLQELYTSGIPDFGIINYRSPNILMMSKRLTRAKGDTYRFTLTDENSRQMNLNGLNWNITLVLFELPETTTDG